LNLARGLAGQGNVLCRRVEHQNAKKKGGRGVMVKYFNVGGQRQFGEGTSTQNEKKKGLCQTEL